MGAIPEHQGLVDPNFWTNEATWDIIWQDILNFQATHLSLSLRRLGDRPLPTVTGPLYVAGFEFYCRS